MTPDQREYVVVSPVPAMLAGGRPVVTGDVVTVDPERNAPLIRAGILTPVEVHEALAHHAKRRPRAPRRRPTKPTE